MRGNLDDYYLSCSIDLGGHIGKVYSIHRAIGFAFIPNPDNLPEINHKNGIKHDNRVENLEWCTESENGLHASYILGKRIGTTHYDHHLSDEQALEIYELCKEGKMKRVDIGAMYGVTGSVVHDIVRKGKNWKHLDLEPLPPLHKGSGGKGTKAPRRRYKVTDTVNNTESIFKIAKEAGSLIGCSDVTVRLYADGKRKKELINGRYKVETLPWIFKESRSIKEKECL